MSFTFLRFLVKLDRESRGGAEVLVDDTSTIYGQANFDTYQMPGRIMRDFCMLQQS